MATACTDLLDREVGDLRDATGPADPKLFSYLRYIAELTREWFDANDLSVIDPRHVQRLDSTAYMNQLRAVGAKVGGGP